MWWNDDYVIIQNQFKIDQTVKCEHFFMNSWTANLFSWFLANMNKSHSVILVINGILTTFLTTNIFAQKYILDYKVQYILFRTIFSSYFRHYQFLLDIKIMEFNSLILRLPAEVNIRKISFVHSLIRRQKID